MKRFQPEDERLHGEKEIRQKEYKVAMCREKLEEKIKMNLLYTFEGYDIGNETFLYELSSSRKI